MEAQSLVSHQHSWWFSCFSLREKLARSHKTKELLCNSFIITDSHRFFKRLETQSWSR